MLQHQMQPTFNTCMATCVAMVAGQPVDEVVERWHQKFHDKTDWLDDALDYYKIPYFYGSQRKAELLYGFIYFLTVPSLNIKGGLHQILMSLTAERGIEVFDPAMGRPGSKYYVWGEAQNDDQFGVISWCVDLSVPVVQQKGEDQPMSTITKERIELFIKNPLENGLTRGEQMELARIALASLEAEPVAWLLSGGGAKNNVSFDSGNAYADPLREVTPLYTAPPAPVSVPAAMEIDDDFDSAFEHGKAVGWNAYRAAMLQAEPVSNSDELPLDYLQGHKDGLEWAAQLAEANHPQTGDWLYDDQIDLARAIRKGPDMPTVQGGSSPVTPDGWIPVSERMPEPYEYVLVTDGFDGCEVMRVNTDGYWGPAKSLYPGGITHWMPLPEPPQEVNRG